MVDDLRRTCGAGTFDALHAAAIGDGLSEIPAPKAHFCLLKNLLQLCNSNSMIFTSAFGNSLRHYATHFLAHFRWSAEGSIPLLFADLETMQSAMQSASSPQQLHDICDAYMVKIDQQINKAFNNAQIHQAIRCLTVVVTNTAPAPKLMKQLAGLFRWQSTSSNVMFALAQLRLFFVGKCIQLVHERAIEIFTPKHPDMWSVITAYVSDSNDLVSFKSSMSAADLDSTTTRHIGLWMDALMELVRRLTISKCDAGQEHLLPPHTLQLSAQLSGAGAGSHPAIEPDYIVDTWINFVVPANSSITAPATIGSSFEPTPVVTGSLTHDAQEPSFDAVPDAVESKPQPTSSGKKRMHDASTTPPDADVELVSLFRMSTMPFSLHAIFRDDSWYVFPLPIAVPHLPQGTASKRLLEVMRKTLTVNEMVPTHQDVAGTGGCTMLTFAYSLVACVLSYQLSPSNWRNEGLLWPKVAGSPPESFFLTHEETIEVLKFTCGREDAVWDIPLLQFGPHETPLHVFRDALAAMIAAFEINRGDTKASVGSWSSINNCHFQLHSWDIAHWMSRNFGLTTGVVSGCAVAKNIGIFERQVNGGDDLMNAPGCRNFLKVFTERSDSNKVSVPLLLSYTSASPDARQGHSSLFMYPNDQLGVGSTSRIPRASIVQLVKTNLPMMLKKRRDAVEYKADWLYIDPLENAEVFDASASSSAS